MSWTGSNSTEQWNWYDGSGQRVMQRTSVGGTVSYTVYAFGLEEHQYNASGTNTGNTSYYSVGGHLIGAQTGTSTKTTTFLLTDLLGSVVASFSNTSGSAAVQGNRAYSPYGTPLYQQGSVGTSRGFTGQYADSTSGLDYYNARYYDPLVGQFVSADSVQGNLQGMNPYAYVGGNPETKTDPSGQCPWCIIGAVVGAVAGAAIDYGMQVYNNYQSGKSNPWTSNINWWQVGGAALTGALLGATLGAAAPALVAGATAAGSALAGGAGLSGAVTLGYAGWAIAEYGANDAAAAVTAEPAATTSAETQAATAETEATALPEAPTTTGACSFTPSTVVTTAHGKQAIGTMQTGEQVLAYNPKMHKTEWEPVEHVWRHTDNDLVDLTITTTTHAPHSTVVQKHSEVIHTNQKHPFYTLEHGFVPVRDLKLGMHVLSADGQMGVITGWKVVPGAQVMYNLEVAQDHTFTVGDGQWVVHNCNLPVKADLEAKQLAYDGISEKGRSFTTVGVAYAQDSNGNIQRLVSMNSNSMSRWGSSVQSLLNPNDQWVPSQGAGFHAEQNLIQYAQQNNLTVLGLGASRNICTAICWPILSQSLSTDVIGTPNNADWIPGWMWLL